MTGLVWGDDRGFLSRRLRPDRVAVPVHYDPDAENEARWGPLYEVSAHRSSFPLPTQAPTIPPGTLSVPHKLVNYMGRTVRSSPDIHILVIDAEAWRSWFALEVLRSRANSRIEGKFTDRVTDVEWTIRLDGDRSTWSSYAFTARPPGSYAVKLPIDPARTREPAAMLKERYLRQLGPQHYEHPDLVDAL